MIAERTCLGCRERASRAHLVRLVARGDAVTVDASARLPGRGAWLHARVECVDIALKRDALRRALRVPKAQSVDDVHRWRDSLAAAHHERTDGPMDNS